MNDPLEIVRVAAGDIELEVLPAVGARLHRLRVAGTDVLRTPDDPRRHLDDPWYWGSYPMAPWCNRIAAGRTRNVAGRDLDLRPNFPDGTAIHGQVSGVAWSQADDETFRVRGGGDGWPWPYEVEQVFEPSADAFVLHLGLTNLADGPMPAGIGIHPWFRRPIEVRIAADATYPSNLEPARDPEPVRAELDRRSLDPFPEGIDAAWTDLDEPPVTLRWPDAGLVATMSTDPVVPYIVAAGPAGVDAVAVEPQTHAPAGIRRLLGGEPGALALLDPGQTLSLAIRLAFTIGKPDSP
jgi:aldose 1-epimerase